jgi:hypothetical protein
MMEEKMSKNAGVFFSHFTSRCMSFVAPKSVKIEQKK